MGLINRVVTPDELRHEVDALAAKIASKSPQAMTTGKRAFYAQREKPLSDAYQYASGIMVENLLQSDTTEGVSAFFEKRTPKWPS
jgi:enoyl-CoA hydratase/carnithine racemase